MSENATTGTAAPVANSNSSTPAAPAVGGRAAILAKHGIVKPVPGAAPVVAKPAEPKPAATPDKSIVDIARLSAENRKLKTELAPHQAAKVVTKDEYLKELRANPGQLFKDIADDPELLVKLAEARNMSPADEERIAERARVQKLEDELKETRNNATRTEVYNATRQVLTDGFESADGSIKLAAKWPLLAKLTKLGEVDGPAEAMQGASKLVHDLTGGSRNPTDAETVAILEIVFDQLEARERRAGEVRRLEAQADEAKNTTSERPKNRPKSLTGAIGQGGHAPTVVEGPPKSKFQRRQERLDRLRVENARSANAG